VGCSCRRKANHVLAMISKILAGFLVATLLTAGVLGWQLKAQIGKTASLKAENAQLLAAVKQAVTINHKLIETVKKLQARNKLTIAQIDTSEANKRQAAKQIGAKNEQVRDGIKKQPEWSDAPIPADVVSGVNDILDRLRNNSGSDRG